MFYTKCYINYNNNSAMSLFCYPCSVCKDLLVFKASLSSRNPPSTTICKTKEHLEQIAGKETFLQSHKPAVYSVYLTQGKSPNKSHILNKFKDPHSLKHQIYKQLSHCPIPPTLTVSIQVPNSSANPALGGYQREGVVSVQVSE